MPELTPPGFFMNLPMETLGIQGQSCRRGVRMLNTITMVRPSGLPTPIGTGELLPPVVQPSVTLGGEESLGHASRISTLYSMGLR